MNKVRILIDLDDVLADFTGAACRIHGISRKQFDHARKPGEWSMDGPLGITLDEFWAPIHAAGEDFWLGIEALPTMRELIWMVESITDDWHIISAPSRCANSYSGKVKWLKKMFGRDFNRFALTPHKHIFAGPNVALIDDRDQNILDFSSAGGTGIIFPTLGNCLYPCAGDPLFYVSSTLKDWHRAING